LRITFLDADSDSLTSYRKGELFESFTRRLVHMAGYEDIRLRVKRSSLEYDIEARSKLHGRTLIGEAKAHEASMNGKEVAAFVGKLLPLAMASEGIDALFISTSPFTPEAEDYLRSLSGPVLSSARINLRTLVGDEIPRFLAINGSSIREDHFRRIAREVTGMEVCDTWLIVGSSGDVLGASFGRNLLSSASHYAVFSLQGKRLELSEVDQQRVSLQVPDLEELVYFDSQPESSPHDEPNNPVTLVNIQPSCRCGRYVVDRADLRSWLLWRAWLSRTPV
jgi:hypothetical protein